MDYEKKYNEALEKARKRVATEPQDHTDAILKDIFPELRESEDERIRKELVAFFKGIQDSDWHDLEIDHILAWLEKQKEPLPIPDKFSGLNSLLLQYFQSAVYRNDDTEIESDTDLWGRKILDYVWKHDEKQKEQKPAWSEEDKRKLNRIYEILGQAADEKPFGSSKRIIGDKEAVELQDFIKLLRPSWKPSEEQMEALEAATVRYQSTGLESLYEDLKKL